MDLSAFESSYRNDDTGRPAYAPAVPFTLSRWQTGMGWIEYLSFDEVAPRDLMVVLNEDSLRGHLVDHSYFDATSIEAWMADKIETDAITGCRVRVVRIEGVIAGWCGIQPDNNGFEMAIVISQRFWGCGIRIFKTLMSWANELGHKEVLFHLLETRREYKALSRMATRVQRTELLGRNFTTYYFPTGRQDAESH